MNGAFLLWLAALLASTRTHGAWGAAYSADDAVRSRPPVVFLHGMWRTPEESCALAAAATHFGPLVCPRGNVLDAGAATWVGTAADASRAIWVALKASQDGTELAWGDGGTLIGYSTGAYFATEVACAEPGRWSGLVLLSMKLEVDPARLSAAGVRRVVLADGERDDSWKPMVALARRLQDAGLQARFVSLGPAAHPLPNDIGSRLCAPIAWVRGVVAAPCADAPSMP
jgi:predicted esterase